VMARLKKRGGGGGSGIVEVERGIADE
jgi:hypothetical protein